VRDKDYVMDLFDAPRKLKKVPSPIAYLLRDDQKETDDLPKPEWGTENAPPKIGAVHRLPRDPKVSSTSFSPSLCFTCKRAFK
jgi:chromatin structure-remodeling complex subunit RSC1/2